MEQELERSRPGFTTFLLVLALQTLCAGSLWAEPPHTSRGQVVYVPVYSHIYSGDREQPFDLAVTVSIRNTDPANSLTISSVDYFDSDGKLVKRYAEAPVELRALASRRYVIAESDRLGGSGANFLVTWVSTDPVSPPILESIMIGTKNQQGISFLSRGQVVRESVRIQIEEKR